VTLLFSPRRNPKAEGPKEGLLDPRTHIASRIDRRGEDDGAAVEQRSDLAKPKPLHERPKVCHRDAVRGTNVVHPAK
jgi:hypothetical protein